MSLPKSIVFHAGFLVQDTFYALHSQLWQLCTSQYLNSILQETTELIVGCTNRAKTTIHPPHFFSNDMWFLQCISRICCQIPQEGLQKIKPLLPFSLLAGPERVKWELGLARSWLGKMRFKSLGLEFSNQEWLEMVPDHIKSKQALSLFKSSLKTFLFKSAQSC